MSIRLASHIMTSITVLIFCALVSSAQEQPIKATPHWDKVIHTSQTTADAAGCGQSSSTAGHTGA